MGDALWSQTSKTCDNYPFSFASSPYGNWWHPPDQPTWAAYSNSPWLSVEGAHDVHLALITAQRDEAGKLGVMADDGGTSALTALPWSPINKLEIAAGSKTEQVIQLGEHHGTGQHIYVGVRSGRAEIEAIGLSRDVDGTVVG